MSHWFCFSCRGRAGGFPLQMHCQQWGQRHKVTSCAVPGLGHGGKEPTCLSPQGLLPQHPIIALTLKDVTAFRRLLAASHGNQEPCDFHPPHPGATNRKGLSAFPHVLLSRGSTKGNAGCGGKSRWCRDVFSCRGESCESAELQTSVRDVRASSRLPDTQLLAGVTAGETLRWAFGSQDRTVCSQGSGEDLVLDGSTVGLSEMER